MSSLPSSSTLTAILPGNGLDASERFYNRLGQQADKPPQAAWLRPPQHPGAAGALRRR